MSQAEKKSFDAQELLETLQNLDFENVGGWPLHIKLGVAALVFVAVLAAGYFLSIVDQNSQLERFRAEESNLRQQYEKQADRAQNLELSKKQMVDMEEWFGWYVSHVPE